LLPFPCFRFFSRASTAFRARSLRSAVIIETDGLPGATERAKLIRWRLTKNIVTGKDAAVASCKLAGLDKELNLYQSEYQNNVIVVQLPENFEETLEGSPRTDGFWDAYHDPMCVKEE
jgi:hypothetical protein